MENYHTVASTVYMARQKESQIQSLKDSISILRQEKELLELEKRWCFDSEGNRTVPTAEEQAAELSHKLADYPHLIEDTVKALRRKKLDLQTDLDEVIQKEKETGLFS